MAEFDSNTDETLLRNIQEKDDKKSFDLLFERYYEKLCHFALNFIKSPDLANEAVSEVFVKLWLNRKKLTIHSSIQSYLYTAVKGQAINTFRREKKTLQTDSIHPTQEIQLTSKLTTDKSLNQEELKQIIQGLMQEMPERQRLIFVMSRIDGLKNQEIAEVLSISEKTVRNQLVNAFKFIVERASRFESLKYWLTAAVSFLAYFIFS